MYEIPTLFAQNCCSALEMNSGPLSIRNTSGGPPHSANVFPISSINRCAGIERSTMFISDRRVCSSIIDAILTALPSTVESNWKFIAHTMFGASASVCGHADAASFAWMVDPHLQTFLFPQSVHFLLVYRHRLIVSQMRPGATEAISG